MRPLPHSSWVGSYIGLPYRDAGRDHKGCDCWGLVKLVLAEQRGLAVPDYGCVDALHYPAVARTIAADSEIDPWRVVPLSEARMFDVVLMLGPVRENGRERQLPTHTGIMTGPTHLLHTERAVDCVHLPISHKSVRHRIVTVIRHKDLA